MLLPSPLLSLQLSLLQLSLLQGEDPASASPPPAASPLSSQLIPLLLVGVLFLFLLILPERKKQKQRQKMLEAVKKGDRVITTSGLYGTVVSASSEVVVLQVADNVRLRFSRAAIQGVLEAEKDAAPKERSEEKVEPSKA
jgi:preprotein translocase subunit YajC